jgi:hypothetical protein
MKVEGLHNHTGLWITLLEGEKLGWEAKTFVSEFAQGGNSHAAMGTTTVNRSHFSAFRIVDDPDDDVAVNDVDIF